MSAEELRKLAHLALVSKICTELDNHLGVADKTLAEFIISLAEDADTPEAFKTVLDKNGAELPIEFVTTLLTIIQRMQPSKPKRSANKGKAAAKGGLAEKYPGLAVDDDRDRAKQIERELLEEAARKRESGDRGGRDRDDDRDRDRDRDRDQDKDRDRRRDRRDREGRSRWDAQDGSGDRDRDRLPPPPPPPAP
eukprot:jgi/Mesvir1/21868/Mv04245-RA.1